MSVPSRTVRAVTYAQLACAAAIVVLVVNATRTNRTGDLLFVGVALASAAIAVAGAWALSLERRANDDLGRSLAAQHELSALLELNPQRVLERFLASVMDIARADGAIVALRADEGHARVAVGAGLGASRTGARIPMDGTSVGRVIQSAERWCARDLAELAP